MLNRSALLQTHWLYELLMEWLLFIWKATHCIYPSSYILSIGFPSWKVSWQLISCTAYTYNWQKVGWALPKNLLTYLNEQEDHCSLRSAVKGLFVPSKFFYCFSSLRELAGCCALHFWPNILRLNQACAFLPYAFVWTVLQLVWMLVISSIFTQESATNV